MTEAAPISLPTSARHRTRPGGVATRWLVIAAIVVFDLIGFRVADIEVNWSSAEGSFELALLFLVYALVLEQVRQRAERFARVQRFAAFAGDFFFSSLQLAVFALVSAPLTYILARANLPLIDAELVATDHFFGFDWTATHDWLALHPAVYRVLRWAYFTHIEQCWVLIALGSLWYPGRRNGELIWCFMISLMLCCAVSAIVPAISMGSDVGSYVPVLKSLRAAGPVPLAWDRLEGIVSFPSFHAALATIYLYAARHRLWAFIPFALLDTLMLASTPPIGGHYLTDVIGGIAVALVAIGVTRRLQPSSLSASDIRLALPPAAVVSVETTRSTAKRAR